MARLLSWPHGLRWNKWKWLSGPQSAGTGSTTTIGNFTQTIASPFGARHVQLSFPPMRGKMVRRARGLITALHMGANAVRIGLCDWDGMSLADAGVQASQFQKQNGMSWTNGMPWDSGKNWKLTKPNVAVAAAAAKDATIVKLTDSYWGDDLGMGDWLGFFPLHLGHYEVTEVLDDGEYRIWPPLRKALTTDDFATLYPVMSMRLLANNLPDAERGASFLDGLTISLFEVFDKDTRTYFTD